MKGLSYKQPRRIVTIVVFEHLRSLLTYLVEEENHVDKGCYSGDDGNGVCATAE